MLTSGLSNAQTTHYLKEFLTNSVNKIFHQSETTNSLLNLPKNSIYKQYNTNYNGLSTYAQKQNVSATRQFQSNVCFKEATTIQAMTCSNN